MALIRGYGTTVLDGVKALGGFVGGFAVGSVGWSAGTGALAGVLSAFGISAPSSALIMLSPVVGLLVGGIAAAKVS